MYLSLSLSLCMYSKVGSTSVHERHEVNGYFFFFFQVTTRLQYIEDSEPVVGQYSTIIQYNLLNSSNKRACSNRFVNVTIVSSK